MSRSRRARPDQWENIHERRVRDRRGAPDRLDLVGALLPAQRIQSLEGCDLAGRDGGLEPLKGSNGHGVGLNTGATHTQVAEHAGHPFDQGTLRVDAPKLRRLYGRLLQIAKVQHQVRLGRGHDGDSRRPRKTGHIAHVLWLADDHSVQTGRGQAFAESGEAVSVQQGGFRHTARSIRQATGGRKAARRDPRSRRRVIEP